MNPSEDHGREEESSSKTVLTDGGTDAERDELFTVSDDVFTETPMDRIERLLDEFVYAPLSIAWSDWRFRIGAPILAFYVLMGTVGVMIVPQTLAGDGAPYIKPFTNPEFILGTDGIGQSMLSQVVHGTPSMLKMLLAGAIFSSGIGLLLGVVAGYKGGVLDSAIMTVTDILLTIPGLPLVLFLTAIYPPESPFVVGIILAFNAWAGLARAIRSQVLQIRENSYVEAARAMGISTPYIITHDVLPEMMPYTMINAANAGRRVILQSVALYFLNILPFTFDNWGVIMNFARETGSPIAEPIDKGHWLFIPAIALAVLIFALVLFAQGLDRVWNPRLRARHAKTIVEEEDVQEESL